MCQTITKKNLNLEERWAYKVLHFNDNRYAGTHYTHGKGFTPGRWYKSPVTASRDGYETSRGFYVFRSKQGAAAYRWQISQLGHYTVVRVRIRGKAHAFTYRDLAERKNHNGFTVAELMIPSEAP